MHVKKLLGLNAYQKGNESNRAIVTSEIISIAKEIGGEGFDDFGEHDIEELLVDEALNDDDILESMVDITKDLETVDSEPEEMLLHWMKNYFRKAFNFPGGQLKSMPETFDIPQSRSVVVKVILQDVKPSSSSMKSNSVLHEPHFV
ncbi:hypothetical protein TNCV_2638731 [Trichonephila clavipes]|nr:hypothetical protein TNCV_2638731 [Trichonephila clavipes]